VKVLIAEPDISYCKSLETDIKEWGYEVISAHDSQEALEAIEKNDIRLALIEWSINGTSAIDLCTQIRQQIQEQKIEDIYIILLAPKSMEFDIIRGLSVGADDYILKPFNFIQLKVRLQNAERTINLEDRGIYLSSYDELTKLWNKKKIVDMLEEELNRGWRESQPTGVIMVDIDYFKKINDTHGHFIGDKVLVEVASRFLKNLRSYDKAGRYGGDEIFVILPNTDLDKLKQIAERLRHVIMDKQINAETASVSVTISLGGTYSDNLTRASGSSLIQCSDNALNLAKKQGRNRAVISEFTSLLQNEQQ
jgi:diguanylate cyclase (GGDEF)-like protein